MAALLHSSAWKPQQQLQTDMDAGLVVPINSVGNHQQGKKQYKSSSTSSMDAWLRKLRLASAKDNQLGCPCPVAIDNNNDSIVIEASSKRHKFSLKKLFKPEHSTSSTSEANAEDPLRVKPPVAIPAELKEQRGRMMVSGKRVSFTRDAHRRQRKCFKPLACIAEDCVVVHRAARSSTEAYRNRAYYPAKKRKEKIR